MSQESNQKHTVFVVSDATGVTGRIVVEAALAQFKDADINLERVSGVRDVGEVKRIAIAGDEARITEVESSRVQKPRARRTPKKASDSGSGR